MDELLVGVEYELLEELRLGLSYQHRSLGRVIEDMSTDGGRSYFIGNPGEFPAEEEQALVSQIEARSPGDPARQQLINRLEAFRQIRRFDSPRRQYDAIQLTAKKRFSRNFFMQGSYTYSRLEGNYPGLFSPDKGQLDPNLTSQYDLFELLGNRSGRLPFDRPHSFKLDGYYTFDFRDSGWLTSGASFRAQSGVPYTMLGYATNPIYRNMESFILPRGSGGRTAFEANVDVKVAYGRRIGGNFELTVYLELLNVFNNQAEATVDQEYTLDAVDPIIGGTVEDLPYLKPTRRQVGNPGGTVLRPDADPVTAKPSFGQTSSRLPPLSGRLGAALSF
jgi:hypothetical protein